MPENFRVIAILSVYNEIDVIESIIRHFYENGIGVYIIDNWSTDGTFELVQNISKQEVIGFERWPKDGPKDYYDWEGILKRKEELSREIDGEWFIHSDADEIMEAPWRDVCLRDAFWKVEQQGYNAVDFAVINFSPIDDFYTSKDSLKDYFDYFEFRYNPGYFTLIRAWKKTLNPIDLHSSGGHEIKFSSRKIFPFKFLIRHYPIRSQEQGNKKVFIERKPRFESEREKFGWHTQYDHLQQPTNFIKSPNDLLVLMKISIPIS